MTKYIDVEKYNNELNKIEDFICGDAIYGMAFARAALNKMSAADVQLIVHCKDCIHREKNDCPMRFVTKERVFDFTLSEGFCNFGDRGDEHD